mgnify:CR=1 FL=1
MFAAQLVTKVKAATISTFFVQARHCFSNMPMLSVSARNLKITVLPGICQSANPKTTPFCQFANQKWVLFCQFANCYANHTWKAFDFRLAALNPSSTHCLMQHLTPRNLHPARFYRQLTAFSGSHVSLPTPREQQWSRPSFHRSRNEVSPADEAPLLARCQDNVALTDYFETLGS